MKNINRSRREEYRKKLGREGMFGALKEFGKAESVGSTVFVKK
jgi:hypothetical protein